MSYLLVKYIISKFKSPRKHKIRTGQNYTLRYPFPSENYSSQEEAYRYFSSIYSNIGKVIVKN